MFEAFQRAAQSQSLTSGIRHSGKLYPYPLLVERAERLASGLLALGIRRGDVVAILMRNSPDIFVLIYALLAIGAVSVPLDTQGNPAELRRLTDLLKLRAIIASPELSPVAEQLSAVSAMDLPLILTHGQGKITLADLEKSAPNSLPEVGPDTDAFYLFSSGSTGRPKVVPRTQGEMFSDFIGSAEAFGFRAGEVMINLLPAHHAFGATISIVYAPLTGTSSVLWTPNKPLVMARSDLLQAIESESITMLPGVPFLFDLLLGATDQAELRKVRMAFSGAVALRKPTFDGFLERFGIPIRQALGTTETSVVSFNASPDPVATWNSVGQLVGQNRVEVVPSEGSSDPAIGELLISSPAVARGYLNDPGATKASFKDGAWVSGDLGRIDADGNLFITGRKKLMVDVAGLKVDPVEVEDVLMLHPAVAEAVVIGIPDPRTGEQRLKAVVVKKSDETVEALVNHAREHLSAHKVPYIIEFIDALPRSSTGKVLRGKLLD